MEWRSNNIRICAIVIRDNELAEDTGEEMANGVDCCDYNFSLGNCRGLVACTWYKNINLNFEHPKSKQTQKINVRQLYSIGVFQH